MIQGGDPLGTGAGGPGYSFPDEFVAGLGHDSAGVLSMANDGPDTNGSQFFITLAPTERLNYLHTVFGRVVQGRDVPQRIEPGDVMHVRILRFGQAALAFRPDESTFAALSAKEPKYQSEMEPGPKAHFEDPDKLLPVDPPRAKNFNFKLGNVQRATGVKIYVRLYAHFVPGPDSPDPSAFAEKVANSLGLDDGAVLAAYFADRDEWGLRVGAAMIGTFTGSAVDPQELAKNGSLANATVTFLQKSRKRADQYTLQSKGALTNNLQIAGQRIKVAVDGVVDELISQLVKQ